MIKKTLLALAARCEAERPSSDLDDAIAEALGWVNLNPTKMALIGLRWRAPNGDTCYGCGPPAYTSSFDAAFTLKPEGWTVVNVSDIAGQEGNPMVELGNSTLTTYGNGPKGASLAIVFAATALRAASLAQL